MLNINTYHNLLRIKNKEEHELALVEENHTVYEYLNGKWTKKDLTTDEKSDQKLTLYGVNKLIIPQIPTLDEEQIDKKKEEITKFINDSNKKYFLLLSRYIGYYTFFDTTKGTSNLLNSLLELCQEIGEIKSIEYLDDQNVIEIWICDKNKNAEAFYFIDWTEGTIVCQ